MDIVFEKKDITCAEDVGPAIEEVRGHLKSIAGRVPSEEAYRKAADEIKGITEQLTKVEKETARALEMAKLGARTLPGAKLAEMPELRAFPRVPAKLRDPEISARVRNRTQYDFLMADPDEVKLILPEEGFRAYQRACRIHDTLNWIDQYMLALPGNAASQWERNGGVKQLRLWSTYEDLVMPFERALSEASGTTSPAPTGTTGTAWVPTGYSTTLIEDIRNKLALAAMFEIINMPQNPYYYPVQGVPFKPYLVAEAQEDMTKSADSPIGARNVQTLNVLFNAKKFAAISLCSTELEEDSIIPIIAAMRTDHVFAHVSGIEHVLINGQNTSTVDTGDIPGTTDIRKAWDGLRYAANLLSGDTRIVSASGSPTGETFAGVKGLMGRYGVSPADVFFDMGYLLYAKCLMIKDASGLMLVATVDKFGPSATIQTGVLGYLLGSPIVVSEDYPQNLDGNGLLTNSTNTKTSFIACHRRAARFAIRRGTLIEASRERMIEYDQILFKSTGRYAFKFNQTPGSGSGNLKYKFVGSGVNFDTL